MHLCPGHAPGTILHLRCSAVAVEKSLSLSLSLSRPPIQDDGDTVCIVMTIGGEGDMRAFRSADAMAAAEGAACDDDNRDACECGYCDHCGWSEYGGQKVPKGLDHVWVVSDWCRGCCIKIIRICATEAAANDTNKACEEDGGWGGIEVQGQQGICKLAIE